MIDGECSLIGTVPNREECLMRMGSHVSSHESGQRSANSSSVDDSGEVSHDLGSKDEGSNKHRRSSKWFKEGGLIVTGGHNSLGLQQSSPNADESVVSGGGGKGLEGGVVKGAQGIVEGHSRNESGSSATLTGQSSLEGVDGLLPGVES